MITLLKVIIRVSALAFSILFGEHHSMYSMKTSHFQCFDLSCGVASEHMNLIPFWKNLSMKCT